MEFKYKCDRSLHDYLLSCSMSDRAKIEVLYKVGAMELTEILPILHKLNRVEKLQVMQFLVSELAQEEADLLKPGTTYPIWSPYDAFAAADTMLKALEAAKGKDDAEC